MPLIDKIRDKLTDVEHVIEVTPEGGDGDEYEALLAGCRAGRSRPGGRAGRTSAW